MDDHTELAPSTPHHGGREARLRSARPGVARRPVFVRGAGLLAAALIGMTLAACQPTASPTMVSNSTTIKCGLGTLSAPTDWYLPPAAPKGLIWLQHGFSESNADFASYAASVASRGYIVFVPTLPTANIYGCTVENIGNNTDFLNNVATLFGTASTAGNGLAASFADAVKRAGRTDLALPTKTAFVGHSAGGEAVLYVANRWRSTYPSTFGQLKGIVLADPVNSFVGNNTAVALSGLNTTPVPIEALASPPYSCNNNQSGTLAVESGLPTRSFHGIQITTGSHGDIFGTSVNALETTTCGTPQPKNVSAAQTLASAWLDDDIAGTHSPAFYPGGSTYQPLVTAGTITTLP